MARSNNNKEDADPAVTNGFPCHENGVTLCSHASKRKRLQKPKIIKENNSPQIVVEKLLKSDNCVNEGKKPQSKPCRRSERKIIPSSLWDNAVINPFFERKRRKLVESPTKSPPGSNGCDSSHKDTPNAETPPKCNGSAVHSKSEPSTQKSTDDVDVDSAKEELKESEKMQIIDTESQPSPVKVENKIEPQALKEEVSMNELHQSGDALRHVRLRRSSRKHSSSVSSISDSKYTIKQELLQKINAPESVENSSDTITPKSESVEMVEVAEPNEPTVCQTQPPECVENKPPIENGKCEEHTGDTGSNADHTTEAPVDDISEGKTTSPVKPVVNKKIRPLKKVVNSKISPVKELVNKKITPSKVSRNAYQHVSGCKESYKSVDDEIEVKTPLGDSPEEMLESPSNAEQPESKQSLLEDKKTSEGISISCNEVKCSEDSVVDMNGVKKSCDLVNPETGERVYIDSLGRRGRKRGRRSRQKLPRAEPDAATVGVPISSDSFCPDVSEPCKTPENEITISKEDITSKEALQLIDGSSFQRFYKMRTRRQNSSNEQTPGASPQPSSTPVLPKRRSSSRSNSSNSKNSEDTASASGETRKRPKHVKPDILCSFCLQTEDERGEEMISCCLCGASGHPSCLQFSDALTQRVKLYQWECIECKKCELCRNSGDDATLLFCDDCDKGFHMSCLKPPLDGEPDGHWSCLYCVDGSTYWKNKSNSSRSLEKSRKSKKSDKASKRKQLLDDLAMFHEAQSRAQAAMTEEAKSLTKTKSAKKKGTGQHPPTIKTIELGCYEITAWYSSPYPAEYALQSKLYICEFCLKYMKSGVIASRHTAKCPARCPPGDEIYRKETISVFEVDGRKNKTYCQNLCLLAKLFLDHKTLYYDVEPFLFYILTEYDRKGCHIVGYFSKEKNSFLSYNVSCILVLPPYMKKGYGKMLIDFSYALSRKEGKLGSPEKPLSDLGLVSYRNYWKERLLEYFLNYNESEITIKHISQTLGFNPYDIVSTLQAYGMIKYHKSNHYVLKRPEMLAAYKRKQAAHAGLPCRTIDMSHLKWTPPTQRENK